MNNAEPKLNYTDEVNDAPTNTLVTSKTLGEVSEDEAQAIKNAGYLQGWKDTALQFAAGNTLGIKQFLKVPFIGRLVYLKTYENVGDTEPVDNYAQVIKVHSPEDPRSMLDLFVILQSGKMLFVTEVQYGDSAGDWSWPPYVPDKEV